MLATSEVAADYAWFKAPGNVRDAETMVAVDARTVDVIQAAVQMLKPERNWIDFAHIRDATQNVSIPATMHMLEKSLPEQDNQMEKRIHARNVSDQDRVNTDEEH